MPRGKSDVAVTKPVTPQTPAARKGRQPQDLALAPKRAAGPIVVHFDDTRLVRDLLGDYDANLAVLEDRLGVQAVVNGNAVSLRGPAESCEIAKDVLEDLYGRLARGEMIGVAEVVGAIRHARVQDADNGLARGEARQIRTRKRLITARTPAQSAYLSMLEARDLVFATGPAGTGKTYLGVAFAAACLEAGRCDRLILSRPAVEAGERLGFLPGDMREKVDPYLRPLYDALYDVLAPERVERGLEAGVIEIAPLAFMRGRTLSNAVIILDEAQNCTRVQMKMFLTRLGDNSKMIVTGDPTQVDLPPGRDSGLLDAIQILGGIDEIGHIAFTGADVVRRELVGRIVNAYESSAK
jgi:phosphate starvation-inducible protein PhoH and related proteins